MKLKYYTGAAISVRIKSKKDFFIYYFNNIMSVTSDDLYENEKNRIKDILELIQTYRLIFKLRDNFSTVKLWQKMKKGNYIRVNTNGSQLNAVNCFK